MTSEELETCIVAVLGPVLGESMARGAIRSQLQRLQLAPPLSEPSIERLLVGLGTGLNVFVGKLRSAQLLEELRRQLHEGYP